MVSWFRYPLVGWPREYGNIVTTGRTWQTQAAPAVDVAAKLATLGIVSTRPITEVKGALKRPGAEPSYMAVLPKGVNVSAATLKTVFADAYANGDIIVVQVRKVG